MYNVMSDNTEVEALAAQVACAGKSPGRGAVAANARECRAQKISLERSPFAQSFELATTTGNVSVRCVRSFVLVGEYACLIR
jgi:hypothetical protein